MLSSMCEILTFLADLAYGNGFHCVSGVIFVSKDNKLLLNKIILVLVFIRRHI